MQFLPSLIRTAFVIAMLASMALAKYENNSSETLKLVQEVNQNPSAEQLEKLGDIYAQGEGVEEDKAEAITWYCFAIRQGSATAAEKLWKIENSMRAKPIKRMRQGKAFNDQATLNLHRYLYLASNQKNTLLSKKLVPQGVKVETYPHDPNLVYAPAYNPALVRKFLSQGADPNAAPNLGDPQNPGKKGNARTIVIKKRDYKTFDFMIAHGACVNDSNNSLLCRGLIDIDPDSRSLEGKPTNKTLLYLISRGANLKNKGFWGNNLLMSCVAGVDNPNGINFLIAKGADANEEIESRYLPVCDKKKMVMGTRVLLMAVLNRNVKAIDALAKAGADLNYLSNGKTMLDYALRSSYKDDQSETSYEKELNRLIKENPETAMANSSVAHLLRLAGAKKASELHGAPRQEHKE